MNKAAWCGGYGAIAVRVVVRDAAAQQVLPHAGERAPKIVADVGGTVRLEFWMGLQANFDLWTTRETMKAELAKIKPAGGGGSADGPVTAISVTSDQSYKADNL